MNINLATYLIETQIFAYLLTYGKTNSKWLVIEKICCKT